MSHKVSSKLEGSSLPASLRGVMTVSKSATSPLPPSLALSSNLFPRCRGDMHWGELDEIFCYLDINEIYHAVGCASRAGFLVFERQSNYRKSWTDSKKRQSSASFLRRANWIKGVFHSDSHEIRPSRLQDKGLLTSYPRSGNSFLRNLLEQSTGIITGSDSRPNRTLSAALLRCGFQGEGVVDPSVWCVKTHYPERLGHLTYHANRAVLLVRNPFDAVLSYFHMGFTNTHDRQLAPSCFDPLQCPLGTLWADFCVQEAGVWRRFHEYWLNQSEKVPVLVVRYEDLVEEAAIDRERAVETVRAFLEGRDLGELGLSAEGERKEWVGETERAAGASTVFGIVGASASPSSPSRSGSGSETGPCGAVGAGYTPKNTRLGASLSKIPAHAILQMERELGPSLGAFGYSIRVQAGQTAASSKLQLHPLDPRCLLHKAPVYHVQDVDQRGLQSKPQMTVNDHVDAYAVRLSDDKYGRQITPLRKSMTKNDYRPFPLLQAKQI